MPFDVLSRFVVNNSRAYSRITMSVTKSPTIAVMLTILCLALIASASCLEPRIIGGTPTTISKHPYQVSIYYDGKLACGGSIISRQWILTAAHCVYGRKLSLFRLRVASSYHDKEGTLIIDIASIIHHKKYREDTYDYDVALIKLFTPLKLGPNVKLILLALPAGNIKAGSKATVTGWGKTSPNGASSKVLRSLTVPVIDQEKCRKVYARYRLVTSNMLCAGGDGEKDTCQGDSGGALVYNGVQIGIVSWGTQCASVGFPGVYTRVSAIRQWITEQANV
ncbi:trypsin-7-like isoform X1 [Temnothorax longispinosus]